MSIEDEEKTRYANIFGFNRLFYPAAHNEMRAFNSVKLSNGLDGTLSSVSFLNAGPSLFIISYLRTQRQEFIDLSVLVN